MLPAPVAYGEVQFVDVAHEVGVDFHHRNGAAGQKHVPETIGSGVAFFDYDGDGHSDLYFVNSAAAAEMYRGTGDGLFVRVTEAAGVASSGIGMGCAAADYDQDGQIDLYITTYGENILYRNNGDGAFADVTRVSGVGDGGFGTGAAFGDYDQDGDLDLYVANYLEYRPELNKECLRAKGIRIYCGPREFEPQPDLLYRNEGGGRFVAVTEQAGILPRAARELGVLFTDYDADGDQDLYVAGDMTPNLLYRNDGGTFAEVGVRSGAAYDEAGKPLAGMGVDAADCDGDGRFDLFVTNFQWQANSLYRSFDDYLFLDASNPSGLGIPSLRYMGWGTAFLDYDNDGDADLFVANGHLDDNVHLFDAVSHPQRNQLFRNDGASGKFSEVTETAGPGLQLRQVSRGVATSDFDGDGDVDIAISNNNEPAALLRNESTAENHWFGVRLIPDRLEQRGREEAPAVDNAVGALVKVVSEDLVQIREVRSGSSYLSQGDGRLFFGLGGRNRVDLVEIRWPGGAVQQIADIESDQLLSVRGPR